MKRAFLWLALFTAVFLLTGCKNTPLKKTAQEQTPESAVTFEKKQECAAYRSAILVELEKLSSIYSHRLDEIFYSPSRDSCLYAYRSVPIIADGIKNLGVDYLIVDYLTNERVAYSNTLNTDTADIYYEERKEELKK